MNNKYRWIFERAPEPTDIFWENLSATTLQRIGKSMVSYFLTFLTILVTLGLIASLKQWKDNYTDRMALKEEELTFRELGTLKFVSILTSLIVMVVNILLRFVIRRYSLSEKHETATKMNVSVAIKLTIARFLNSSVTIILVNATPETWFQGGDLVYDASILIILLTF